ncbi:hypothetical protein RAZWK3B_13374 [Roseobacter sp. AzwK-3b]|jgi:hypothetical protein|uniref:Lipoprotein n=1 Tax=Roseovarius litoreus TaxID=1155722 RepID=A0A1M7CJ77_9RHOB|nr:MULTISPECIES: hypothetical protein [Roseobacteraceae]EDM71214.1 hypothetical protein RAZWK3B_13374 [Roseobacter sp. AzwK-3b]SHL67331.1 hypothetical protein SAMN05443432_102180 [Roseovarius litoreus]
MRALILMTVSALMLAACSERSERVLFDGMYFPAKAKKASDDRLDFEVSVRRASQSLEAAQAAGRHEGTRYCIENFGTSEIAWSEGPDGESGAVQMSNGNLMLKGRCVIW